MLTVDAHSVGSEDYQHKPSKAARSPETWHPIPLGV